MTVGANRIVPTIAIPHPLGNPSLSHDEEYALRKKLVNRALEALTTEVSSYLMMAVAKMFRLLYSAEPHNAQSLFSVEARRWPGYADAVMRMNEANVEALLAGENVGVGEGVKDPSSLSMTTESLTREFPLYTPSLLNLVKTSETRVKGLGPEQ